MAKPRAVTYTVPDKTIQAKRAMKLLLLIICWCLLAVLCWPLAILAMVLFPLIWLLLLPFRLVGIVVEAALALIRGILFLPARLLGFRR